MQNNSYFGTGQTYFEAHSLTTKIFSYKIHLKYISRPIFKLSKESFAGVTRSYFLETTLKDPVSNAVSLQAIIFVFPSCLWPQDNSRYKFQLNTMPPSLKPERFF